MKYGLIVAVIFVLSGPSLAGSSKSMRVADGAEVCLANCSSENESCKRVCPTTYNVPCLSACDNQAQACRQSCQRK